MSNVIRRWTKSEVKTAIHIDHAPAQFTNALSRPRCCRKYAPKSSPKYAELRAVFTC